MDNYLSAADLLIERLKTRLMGINAVNIRVMASIDSAVTNALHKSVNVIFFDDVPDIGEGGQLNYGAVQYSTQYWLILLSWRNATDAGATALKESGAALIQIFTALQGYALSPAHGELYRARCPYRVTVKDSFSHFPLMFSTKIMTSSIPTNDPNL